jgi:hypothetical protein
VVDWFADQVAGQFQGKLLHGSRRAELLKTADRLGISRFNANLVIAVAQNQAEDAPASHAGQLKSRPRFTTAAIALVVIVQSLIAWGAWRILRGN